LSPLDKLYLPLNWP